MLRIALVLPILLFAPLWELASRAKAETATSTAGTAQSEGANAAGAATEETTRQRLQQKVERAIALYKPRMLNTREHSPWEIMHSLIAFGTETQSRQDGPAGKPASSIGLLCFNHPAAGLQLFYPRKEGIGAQTGPGLQGHHGQFLAMMAQSRVPITYPLLARGKKYTLADLVKFEQDTCEPKSELTFKLIALAHYLPLDATWTSQGGQPWSIPRLIREELEQPIRGATCGGTHRLFGLSYAVYKRRQRGEPIDGEYRRAEKFVRDYHAYTFRMQNSDGSFSTEWFNGSGDRPDPARKLQTTGHILEWAAFSLPQEELFDPRTIKAVDFLAGTLIAGKDRQWEIGPQGHALHSLVIYRDRAFGKPAGDTPEATDGKSRAGSAPAAPVVKANEEPRYLRRRPAPAAPLISYEASSTPARAAEGEESLSEIVAP